MHRKEERPGLGGGGRQGPANGNTFWYREGFHYWNPTARHYASYVDDEQDLVVSQHRMGPVERLPGHPVACPEARRPGGPVLPF
jgi:hypothetical protein